MTWTHDRRSGSHLDRLLTFLFSTAFGFLVLHMFSCGWMKVFVGPEIRPYVVFSGIALLTLVSIRVLHVGEAALSTLLVDEPNSQSSDRSGSLYDRDSDAGWIPIRCIVLCAPLLLYAIDLPIEYFGRGKDPAPTFEEMTPSNLMDAASDAQKRKKIEGKIVRVQGYLLPRKDTVGFVLCQERFAHQPPTLLCQLRGISEDEGRLTMNRLGGKWVEALGRVEFRQVQDVLWLPVLIVQPGVGETLSDFLKLAQGPDRYL